MDRSAIVGKGIEGKGTFDGLPGVSVAGAVFVGNASAPTRKFRLLLSVVYMTGISTAFWGSEDRGLIGPTGDAWCGDCSII